MTTIILPDFLSSWTVPAGVTSIQIEIWGGGGGGGGSDTTTSSGGGGGGSYVRKNVFAVTPGDTLHYVYAGGGGGTMGTDGTPGDTGSVTEANLSAGGGGGGLYGGAGGAGGIAGSTGSPDVMINGSPGAAADLAGQIGGNAGNSPVTASVGGIYYPGTGGTGCLPGVDGDTGFPATGYFFGGGGGGGSGDNGGSYPSRDYSGGYGQAGTILVTYFLPGEELPTTTSFWF